MSRAFPINNGRARLFNIYTKRGTIKMSSTKSKCDQLAKKNAEKKKPVAKRHMTSTAGCDMSFCMHYNEAQRRCGLRKCFYDCKQDTRLNTIQLKNAW